MRRVVYSCSSSTLWKYREITIKRIRSDKSIVYRMEQKYYGEVMCKMFSEVYGLETVSLRYFNIYGERQNVGGGEW